MFSIVTSAEKLDESLNILSNDTLIACDTEASSLDTKNANLEGIGYGTKDNTFFIPFPNKLEHDVINQFLQKLFNKEVIFHNAKFDLKMLLHNDFVIPEKFHDTMIMSWLIDENSRHGLKALAKEILDIDAKKFEELDREINLFRTEQDVMEELAEYCCEDIKNTYKIYEHFFPLLEKEGVLIDYERVELKLISVLVNMEMRGIKVDVSWLQEKQGRAKAELAELEKTIVTKLLGGRTEAINIRSPKQIEKILFEMLGYVSVKETNSKKRSTDNEVLETIVKKYKLKEDDIVPMLLKFRDLDKVYGTYLVAIAEQAGAENVIRANFMQHGTRTGRLASNEPNLQNIPARNDAWNVREAFIPREGYKFLMADYSQIELRILAHFSQDENMVETFLRGGDIHGKTMELTGTNRHTAKAINFGLIYGMGPRLLAHTLGIKEDDARRYIRKFFDGYPQVRYFIDRVQQQALRTGTVQMITGRKRHFHEYKDQRWFNTIQRQSINTKIQGSAADLIKIAMIKLDPALRNIGAYQLVQIHDEIIVETPNDKVEEVKVLIHHLMEQALQLRVPLVVNIVEGDRWIKE